MVADKKDKKYLKNNTISLIIIQILNYVLPFITLPYITRILEVDKLGLCFFAQSIVEYISRVVSYGFEFSGVRQIAINSNNQHKVNVIFNNVFFTQITLFIVCLIFYSIAIYTIPKLRANWIIYYICYFWIIGGVMLNSWFYQGMAKMRFMTYLNIAARVVSLSIIFIFIKQPDDYLIYPMANSLSYVIAGLISIYFIKKCFNVKIYLPKIQSIIKTLKFSFPHFITKISIALYRSVNAMVLGFVVTPVLLAYYVAADRILWSVLSLFSTFIMALFPFMSKSKDLTFFKKALKYYILLAIGASVFLIIISKYLIFILYSEKFYEAIPLLRIFALSLFVLIFVDVLGYPFLGAFGYVKETNNGYIFGGIYNAIGLIILYLLDVITIFNVAILVSSTYLVMLMHRLYYVYKYRHIINATKYN